MNMRNSNTIFYLAAGAACIMACSAFAAKPVPTQGEMDAAHRWIADSLKPAKKSAVPPAAAIEVRPSLLVLENLDRVVQNRRGDGIPIKIGKAVFDRGLLCHAVSKVVVRLPGPGKTFNSIVGIHANAGGGSVIFSVKVGGKEAFRSGVLHCGNDGVPVNVDLGGANEFTLAVGDAGDGINCDQSDWADAKVTLADGREIWLGDLPIMTSDIPKRAASAPPFSFIYDGKPSDDLLARWKARETTERLDKNRTRRTRTYADPDTGLEMRWVLVEYNDYPTVEWTVYFKNTGKKDTPILKSIQALDIRVRRGSNKSEFVLNHNVGSLTTPKDYCPLVTTLVAGEEKHIGTVGGRPLNTDMPYFNLEWGDQGMIIALGWPGQWSSRFIRDAGDGLWIVGGQELTRFRLLPGEEVRTPLVAIQFWQGGDRVRSQNIWRRWMIAHNLPRPGGQLLGPVFSGAGADLFPYLVCGQADEIPLLEGYARRGLRVDYWWRDAGWYPCRGKWWNTGTWEPDPILYPGGLRAVADRAHANGMKFIVWFEPERAVASTWLTENHPEWVLGGKHGGLVNLGNPEAWRWLVNRVDNLITEQHIDMYRQDFNLDPLPFWRSNDAEDRLGITENHHVVGLLSYWDELRRRHPDMPIDCCASGGRRNELESMRRGVPLSKSDHAGGTTSSQCQLYGIASWLPYFGSGVGTATDLYPMRCNMAPWSAVCYDTRKDNLNYDLIRRFLAEWRQVAPYYLGDFYPLTPYSLEENVWMAWQFDVPEKGEGMVQVFRREKSQDDSAAYKLQGLEPGSLYTISDFDADKPRRMTGRDLAEKGLPITLAKRPWAATIIYKKIK